MKKIIFASAASVTFFTTTLLSAVHAEIVTYRFEAARSQVSSFPYDAGSDAEQAAAFDMLTGEFSWDTSAGVLSAPAPVRKDYDTGVIVIDQFALSGHYAMSTVVVDRAPDPANHFATDQFQIRGVGDSAAREDNVTLNFSDRTATALSGLALPLSLDASAFEPATLTFIDVQPSGAFATPFVMTLIEHVPGDTDGDGVPDAADYCPGTIIPEAAPSSGKLGHGRHALTVEEVFTFTSGKAANASYTTEDTAGCSCTQIVGILALGQGQLKNGCSNSVMEAWVRGLR